jgi:methylated-DNA-[protein]-cysteine S-methyltransferase
MHRTIPSHASPIGPLTLVADHDDDGNAALTAILFEPPSETVTGARDDALDAVLEQGERELGEYFRGERTEFTVPIHQPATEFQRSVWDHLLTIPFGETTTYGDIAKVLGNPNASRAVGLANGSNRIPIIVPCHRVLNSKHEPHGYAGGLDRKRALLDLERASAPLFADA